MKSKIGIIVFGTAIALAIFYVVSQLTKTNAVVAANVPGTPTLANSPLTANANQTLSYGAGVAAPIGSLTSALASFFSGNPRSPSPVSPTTTSAPTYGPTSTIVGVNNGQPLYAATGYASTSLNPATDPGTAPSLLITDNPVNLDYVAPAAPGIFPPGIATDTSSDYSSQVGTGSLLYAS